MLKIRKKIAIFVLVIIMTVGMIGCSSIFKIVETVDKFVGYDDSEWIESNINDEQIYKEQLESLEANGDKADPNYVSELYSLKSNIHYYYINGTYTKENSITELSFKKDILSDLDFLYGEMLQEEYFSEQGTESPVYIKAKSQYDKLDNIIKTGDYKTYIEFDNQRISENSDLSEVQKKYQIEYNNALYKICPTGIYKTIDEKDNAKRLLSQKTSLETSLELDYDIDTNGNMTDERRKEIELSLAVVNKKIEESILVASSSEQIQGYSYSISFGVGNLFTVVILIILAGAMMSGETSTGTIKSLIIAPVRRWKIYVAKYLSLIFTIIVLTLYVYITSVLINGLLFGFSSYGEEVYIAFGKVVSMNFFVVQFAYALCSMISLLVVVTFAYMMSIVTKNTAAAVSVTMGVYLGGGTIHTLLMGFLSDRPYLTKFLPFNNIELFDLIFNDGNSDIAMEDLMGASLFESPSSFTFASIYVLVLLVCMIWIGLDSFCKKDIK